MLFLGVLSAEAQHYDRGYEMTPSSPFVKKGTWVAGGTARYSQHLNDDYNLLVISDINSKGYNISVNPKLLYMVKDIEVYVFLVLDKNLELQTNLKNINL